MITFITHLSTFLHLATIHFTTFKVRPLPTFSSRGVKMPTPLMSIHLLLLTGLCTAIPLALQSHSTNVSFITAALVQSIVPNSATCYNPPKLAECRTAAQAAPPIANSFLKYGVTSTGEIAALVALIGYESGDFKYQINYWPGNAGQGSGSSQILLDE